MEQPALDSSTASKIAIIGMAGRFPGAPDIDAFWRNIRDGVESITFYSDEELLANRVSKAELADPSYVKAAAVIDGADLFDARYFNFSPKEAEYIDPQHRAFLECALEAFENAGCNPLSYEGSIGVFGGSALSFYELSVAFANLHELKSSDSLRTLFATGVANDYLATRVSYKLRLRGPGLTIQTACSTSLVAVHLACQSLLSGECDMALAGGVSIQSSYSKAGYFYTEGGMVSPDGHCRPFDAAAKGTIFGDGVGIVVLKRLDRALADGDNVRAVILGSAINNDGSEKLGFAAPGVKGQVSVIAEALAMADVSPESISYIEAHGTATELGDPIEIHALTEAFRASTDEKGFCRIGSVKGNVGHLNHAAGVTGLIKTVLSLEHSNLPPSLHFTHPNPNIDFANSPFYVNTTLSPWNKGPARRLAGVNAFGIGGTNAHVIVEEAPEVAPCESQRAWHVLCFSAKSPTSRDAMAEKLGVHLRAHGGSNIADIAFTLASGRIPHKQGCAVICRDAEDAATVLESRDPRRLFTGDRVYTGDRGSAAKTPAFMFPGQGTQRVNMGAGLYRDEPVYRAHIDRCASLALPHLGEDLRDILFPTKEQEAEAEQRLTETAIAQPALFATSYALAELWKSWGVQPHAMIGHSIGELVAACLAGVFDIEDAIAVVVARGKLMQAMPRGSMLIVPAAFDAVAPRLDGDVSLAALNAPGTCVVSGSFERVATLEQTLRDQGIFCTPLRTSHAFHSKMMAPAVGPFVEQLRKLELKAPTIPFVSNVTGTWITDTEATDPEYWGRQLLEAVRFGDGIGVLHAGQFDVLLEVGPGRALSTLARQNIPDVNVFVSLPRPDGSEAESESLLQAAAQLWLTGVPVAWTRRYDGERRRKIPLPPYCFERERYWAITDDAKIMAGSMEWASAPMKPELEDSMFVPTWKPSVRPARAAAAEEISACNWLVFAADDAVSREFVASLRARNAKVAVVTIGAQFEQGDGLTFTVALDQASHYEKLLSLLRKADASPDHVVYLWSVLPSRLTKGARREAIARTFYGLMYVIQAFAGVADLDKRIELTALVAGTQDVLGGEPITPVAATTLGLCLVAPLEHENIACRYIDLARKDLAAAGVRGLIGRIIDDLAQPAPAAVMAYRGRRLWVPHVEPLALEQVEAGSAPIRQGGVYLITGGLGDLGLAFARFLAESAKAKLILVSRSGLPPREDWDQVLADAKPDGKQARIIRAVRDLEKMGAEVMVAASDAADLPTMRAIVKQARERFGTVHGAIHAAGIAGVGPILMKTSDIVGPIITPKIGGVTVLDQLFADEKLDFLVLFSTIASLVGGIGQGDYTAANAYLDAFARQPAFKCAHKVVSINWDAWGEVGMAVTTPLPEPAASVWAEELKKIGIPTAEGIDAFQRILSADVRQVLICKRVSLTAQGSVEGLLRLKKALPRATQAAAATALSTGQRYPRPKLAAEYVAPRSELERILAGYWSEALNIDGIGVHDDFFELGGHSLLALQLIPQLRSHFKTDISPRDLFGAANAATIAELARVVEEKLVSEIEQMEATVEELEEVADSEATSS